MKMLKTLALTVLAPTLIKAVSEGYEWMCEQFGCEEEVKERKKNDMTKLTNVMEKRVKDEHTSYMVNKTNCIGEPIENTQELTKYLNSIYGLTKSRSVYSRIWNEK